MTTTFNAQQLADIYEMSESTYHSLLAPHREKINNLSTYKDKFKFKGKGKRRKKVLVKVKTQNYSTEALEYIVFKVMGDAPYNYVFNGKTLVADAHAMRDEEKKGAGAYADDDM